MPNWAKWLWGWYWRLDEYRMAVHRKLVAYFGGKCQACGYNKTARALQFHLNPTLFNVMKLTRFGFTKKWSTLLREAEVCTLLCGNCHAEVHDGLLVLNEETGQLEKKRL